MVTVFWLSEAVENIWAFLVGITEFLGINFVITPPTVSIPIVRGLTSNKTSSPKWQNKEVIKILKWLYFISLNNCMLKIL